MNLICIGCNRTPSEIPGIASMALANDYDNADAFVLAEEGTLNRRNGHFLCDECYIRAGQPSSPNGWKAP